MVHFIWSISYGPYHMVHIMMLKTFVSNIELINLICLSDISSIFDSDFVRGRPCPYQFHYDIFICTTEKNK